MTWKPSEQQLLILHYPTMTIKELLRFFSDKSEDSINAKIKRLKRQGKIKDNKDKATIDRAYRQRGKDV